MNGRHLLAAAATPTPWRVALVMLAGIAVVAQLVMPVELPHPGRRQSVAHLPLAEQSRGAAKRKTYAGIAAHPLFYPTRLPWAPPARPAARSGPAASAPPVLAKYTVLGVIISEHTRVAFLRLKNGGKTILLSQGQALKGWKLRKIGRNGLVFASGGKTYRLIPPMPRWPPSR